MDPASEQIYGRAVPEQTAPASPPRSSHGPLAAHHAPDGQMSAGGERVLSRLLGLLAQEAPLEQFHTALADLPPALSTDPGDEGATHDVHEAVRAALSVRTLLATRRRRERELAALYETAGDLSSTRDLEAVLQAIVQRARQLLDTDAAYLMLNDQRRRLTSMRVTDGIRTDAFKRAELELGLGLGGLVAATGTPCATADYGSDEQLTGRVDDIVSGEGLVAILGVPLRRGSSVIGVLFAANRRQRPFSPDETALLLSLADHAAVALENAALFQDLRAALDELSGANRLVQQHSEQVERAAALHERLSDVMLSGGGLPEVARVAADVLGGELVIVDGTGHARAVVGDGERLQKAAVALSPDDPEPGDFPLRTWQGVSADGVPVVVAPAYAGAEVLGRVVLVGARLDGPEVRQLERVAVVAALQMLQERTVAEAEQRVRGELIDDLVAQPQRDPDRLRERTLRLGVDLDEPHVVVVARPVDPDRCEAALRTGQLPGEPRPELHGRSGDDLVLLVRTDDPAAAAQRLGTQLSAAGGCAFTVGAAGPAAGAGRIPELHRDATRCCEVLIALDRVGECATSDDLGVYGLLLSGSGRGEVEDFVRRTVGPLLDHDRSRGSELARTLLVYYACGSNLTRTAAALFVHVNTLYQRLDRVTSLLGAGWRSGDGALQVHLALQLHRAMSPAP